MVWWVTVASILGFLSVSALSQQLAITRYDAVIWLIIAGFLALLLLTIALFSHAMWHKKSRQFNRFVIPVTGLCIVKYAVVAMLTVSAIVTPPDVMSQVIMFAVIYPLYEGSIFLVRRIEKKREAQMRAEGTWIDDEDDDA